MKRSVWILCMTLVVGITLGLVGERLLMAQQTPVTRTILQQKDIEGIEGREAVMFVAEIVPGGVAAKHFHPGPELFYVLQGTLVVEPEGGAPLTLKAGESAYNPSKRVHTAKNASTSEPVKVLGVLIGEKGQPLATQVQ